MTEFTRESELAAIRLIREKNLPVLNKTSVSSTDKKLVINFLSNNNFESVAEYISELDLEDFAEWLIDGCGDDSEEE
jgi:ferritin